MPSTVIVVLGAVVAALAAVRSTWSPCGVSMLSTLTPLAERSRGHRFGVTATWFALGATLGGLALGLVAALAAAAVHTIGLTSATALGIAAVAAWSTAVSDTSPFGWHLPVHHRQVNEVWLTTFRPWVYAGGFGLQIGSGLATYITTAAVYLLLVLAALTASPAIAVALATGFGLGRGLAVLLARRITSIEQLHSFHRRFEQWREPVRWAVIAGQLGVAGVAATAAGAAPAIALAAAGATFLLAARPFLTRSRASSAPIAPRSS
jgi:hypothetical protein